MLDHDLVARGPHHAFGLVAPEQRREVREQAHRRGLELHAWFNPYRSRHPSAKSDLSTKFGVNLVTLPPGAYTAIVAGAGGS